jgi:head-tail adaptor
VSDPGDRPHLVSVQRASVTVDTYGNETPGWGALTTAWARVRYGTGQERREAAQERASQAATFEFDWNPTLAALTPKDRLVVFETAWDIASAVVIGGNYEVHVAAVANLDAELGVDS